MSPKAPGWLQGCIGPGLKFNTTNKQIGRQKGTGKFYLDPAKAQSTQAVQKLLQTLYSVGSYKMEIVNYGGVSSTNLPKSFTGGVQAIAKSKNLILSSGSSGGNTSTSSTFIYNPQKASESITPPTNTLQAGDIVTVTINYNDGENIGTGVGTATVQSLSRRDVAIRSARLKAKGSLTDQFSN
tara:strand:+ start:26 stop:574 length:549 start_codon:yes stop_codon:yes gene_type:complete